MLSVPLTVLLSPKYQVYTVPLGAPLAVLAKLNTSLLGAQGDVEVYAIPILVKAMADVLPLPEVGGVMGVGAGLVVPPPVPVPVPEPVEGVGAGVVDPLPVPELLPDELPLLEEDVVVDVRVSTYRVQEMLNPTTKSVIKSN